MWEGFQRGWCPAGTPPARAPTGAQGMFKSPLLTTGGLSSSVPGGAEQDKQNMSSPLQKLGALSQKVLQGV